MRDWYSVGDVPRRRFLEVGLKGGVAIAASPFLVDTFLSTTASGTLQAAPLAVDRAMIDRVLRKALAKGGTFADVYLENRVSRDILMEEGRFKSAQVGISQGAGVRVIVGDKTGYAYTD